MSRKEDSKTFFYVQPVYISTNNFEQWEKVSLERSIIFKTTTDRLRRKSNSSLKIKDIVKANKEYKIYDDQLHFYNALYEVELSNQQDNPLREEYLTLELKTQKNEDHSMSRSFKIKFNQITEKLKASENITVQVIFSCDSIKSELYCYIASSPNPLPLSSLQKIFDDKWIEKHNLWDELVKSEFLETKSSTFCSSSRGKFSRKKQNTKQKIRDKILKNKNQSEQKVFLLEVAALDKQTSCESKENSAFYDQSPKKKKFHFIRRSLLVARSVHCQMDDVDHEDSFFHYMKVIKSHLHNFLIVLGVILIIWVMNPSKRV